ncbi:hypothetical protein HUT18_20335 [Streptomyces sp. NA04227]|uniref:hypothetical protein n=1 Tax=Streptomyces sp. NA04227 TaxID=2742136 RepID=UPI001592853D|nr:hypothetical protein [Streptomyces sp. NA04227]QKW08369.1 hypothetical protein HUT18_20335 [Streptomyces sp. NA04227]
MNASVPLPGCAGPGMKSAPAEVSSVAARRALYVLLLLGGFLALAWMTAGEAHAEDSPQGPAAAVAGVTSSARAAAEPVVQTRVADSSVTASVAVPHGRTAPVRVTATVESPVDEVVDAVAEPVRGKGLVPPSTRLPSTDVELNPGDVLPGRPSHDPPPVKSAPRAEVPSAPVRTADSVADAEPYDVVAAVGEGLPYADGGELGGEQALASPSYQDPDRHGPGDSGASRLPCPFGVGPAPCTGTSGDQPTHRKHDPLATSPVPGPRPALLAGPRLKDSAPALAQRPHDVVELPG